MTRFLATVGFFFNNEFSIVSFDIIFKEFTKYFSNVKREQTISDKQKREQKKRNEQEKGKTNNFLL